MQKEKTFEPKAISNLISIASESISEYKEKISIDSAEKAIEKLGNTLRKEMESTLQAYREEMQKNFEQQKRELQTTAMWQWITCIGIIAGAVIKSIYYK